MTTLLPNPQVYAYNTISHTNELTAYSEAQLQAYGKAEYERGLLDAMNATRAFGKTGEVIAVIIAALKEKKE